MKVTDFIFGGMQGYFMRVVEHLEFNKCMMLRSCNMKDPCMPKMKSVTFITSE